MTEDEERYFRKFLAQQRKQEQERFNRVSAEMRIRRDAERAQQRENRLRSLEKKLDALQRPETRAVGERLKRARRRRGMNQEATAHAVGISLAALKKIEQGRTKEPHPDVNGAIEKFISETPK